jgi:hypothetical protein
MVTDRSLPAELNLLAFTTGMFLQIPNYQAQSAANIAEPCLAVYSIPGKSFQAGITPEAFIPVGVVKPSQISHQEDSELEKIKQDSLDRLYATFSECCREGWDGYDGSAVSYENYLQAKRLVESLPAHFPAPEIAADPDGEVSFEWYREPGRVFSVSISANAQLTYAGKFSPSEKTQGTVRFTGQLPKAILDDIRRLLA